MSSGRFLEKMGLTSSLYVYIPNLNTEIYGQGLIARVEVKKAIEGSQ